MKHVSKVMVLFALMALLSVPTLQAGPDNDRPGWLGVNIRTINEQLYDQLDLKLPDASGVLVLSVVEDSPAEKAGLQKNDVIVSVDGTKLTDADQLRELVAEHKDGDEVSLRVIRDGDSWDLKATLTAREQNRRFEWFDDNNGSIPPQNFDYHFFSDSSNEPVGYLGIGMSPLTDQLGKFFGADNSDGVLITEVVKDGPAEKAGLKAGDVILEVNGEKIKGTGNLSAVIQKMAKGDKADIKLMRDRKVKSLPVELDEKEAQFFGSNMIPDIFNLQPGQIPPHADAYRWRSGQPQSPDDDSFDYRYEMDQLRKDLEQLKQELKQYHKEDSK